MCVFIYQTYWHIDTLSLIVCLSALVVHTCSLAPEETDGEGWSSANGPRGSGSHYSQHCWDQHCSICKHITASPTQCHVSVENMWNGGGVLESVCANSCDWGRGDCGHEINNASNMCVCVRITRVYRMDIIYYSQVDVYYTLLFFSFLFYAILFYFTSRPGPMISKLAPWYQNWCFVAFS